MSRNLGSTVCAICPSERVKLEEEPRPIAPAECRPFTEYLGSLIVARAYCEDCGAKYLAWVRQNFSSDGNSSPWRREPSAEGPPFVDLSFRLAFNDEPLTEDLPDATTLKRIHIEQRMRQAAELREKATELLKMAVLIEEAAPDETSVWEVYRRTSP